MIEKGKRYKIKSKKLKEKYGHEVIWIEDLWVNVYGKSWMWANNNPAALQFAMRTGFEGIPLNEQSDNKVYYGKMSGMGELVCECELGDEVK